MVKLKAPFPYFGGKSSIYKKVWSRFGVVKSYIEPFCGSASICLLNPAPQEVSVEILNDFDGMITNVWRSIKWSPDQVKEFIDWPMNELDMHSRAEWVEDQRAELENKLQGEDLTDILRKDPHYHDPKIAAWWIWGLGCAIGDSFTEQKKSIPCVLTPRGVHGKTFKADQVFDLLSKRLKRTKITCGDWGRVVKENMVTHKQPTAIFLDPPYASKERHKTYTHESYDVASEVNDWCVENGGKEGLRIILAGYKGDYDLPQDQWTSIQWETPGGYGNITRTKGGSKRGKENATKEIIWANKNCLTPSEGLFHDKKIE